MQATGEAEFREFLKLGLEAKLEVFRSLNRHPPGSVIYCYLLLHLSFPVRDRGQVFVDGKCGSMLRELVG